MSRSPVPVSSKSALGVPKIRSAALSSTRLPLTNRKSLHYTLLRRGASNIWEQPLTGGPPRQITSFTDQLIGGGIGTGFAWSRGGKQLAVIRGQTATDIVLMTNFN